MSRDFIEADRGADFLLPPSLDDWLPQKHLARFVVEIVDQLDLGALTESYVRGGLKREAPVHGLSPGRRAYHPAMLLSLLFYGYATGVFSSRKLEQATYDSVAFRYITGNLHPDHDTIASFRKRFLPELEGLFVQILMLAQAAGVLRIGRVSLDGTKVKANASKHKALSWAYADRLEKQLQEEVVQLLAKAGEADAGAEDPGLSIPDELERREDRLAVIAAAKATIAERAAARHAEEQREWAAKMAAREARQRETGRKSGGRAPKEPEPGPRAKDQVNFTDPESRIMLSSEGFVQAYNAQAVVDNESHLIVAGHVGPACNDKQQLEPALARLQRVEAALGKPEALLADSGYFSRANVEACETAGITPYIASGRDAHNEPLLDRMSPSPPCPGPGADTVDRARHRVKTPEGKAIYGQRKATVETVFGIVKAVLGFRRFHLRGQEAANGEWTLVSLAWNLKRMHALTS